MTRFRSAIVVLAAGLGTAGFAGLAAFGCSSSSSHGEPPEGGPDVTNDVAKQDVIVNETGPEAEAGTVDASDGGDSAPEAEAGPAAGEVFAYAEANAICAAWKSCCATQDPGAGTFNTNDCVGNLVTYGWEGNLAADQSIYSHGNVTVDQAKASACLTAIAGFQCPQQTGAGWATITDACRLVITGTIPIGQTGCNSSFECATGGYCDYTAGTGGTCKALATAGQACNTVASAGSAVDGGAPTPPLPDEMCSYLASGQPAMYCDLIDPPGSANYQTCQPVLAAGGLCYNTTAFGGAGYYDDQACPTATPLCGDDSLCGDTASYPNIAGSCAFYAITDAGGGG
jgi:hypothetical protein